MRPSSPTGKKYPPIIRNNSRWQPYHYQHCAGRLKHENISCNSRVAVSVIDQTNPYDMVTVRGRVVEQTTNGADEHIDKMAKRYLGVDKYPGRMPGEKRVILKIKPDKVFHQKPPR